MGVEFNIPYKSYLNAMSHKGLSDFVFVTFLTKVVTFFGSRFKAVRGVDLKRYRKELKLKQQELASKLELSVR